MEKNLQIRKKIVPLRAKCKEETHDPLHLLPRGRGLDSNYCI